MPSVMTRLVAPEYVCRVGSIWALCKRLAVECMFLVTCSCGVHREPVLEENLTAEATRDPRTAMVGSSNLS